MLLLALILTTTFAVITWKNLHTGLLLIVAVLPSYLLRTDVFGIPTTLLELLVVTYLLIWSIKFLGSRRLQLAKNHLTERGLKPAATLLPIFLLLAAATISLFIAPDLVSALGVWKAYFVEPILLFFVIRHELSTTKPMNVNVSGDTFTSRLFMALGISALVLSTVGLMQWLTGAGLPIPWDIERRVTSVFDYPNALGLFLGPIVIVAIMSLGKKKSWFWFTTAVLSLIVIILAQSEAAIVSILATLSIVGVFHDKTRYPTVVGILVVVIAVLFSPWRALVTDKLTLQDYSGQVRLSQWSETIDMLGDHWLLGTGLSGYPTALEPYHQATHLEIFQYPHNIVLNIWVELGLLGLVAVGWVGYQVVVSLQAQPKPRAKRGGKQSSGERLLRRFAPRNDTSNERTLGMTQTIAFFALLQMTIHGLVDVPYFKNDLAILTWILLAIILSKDCFAGARNDTNYARPTTPSTPSQ